jgi:hypothetical protein
VLPVDQPAGECLVLFHQVSDRCAGLGDAHLGGRAIAVDMRGQRAKVECLAPVAMAWLTRCCIATSASVVWLAQHHPVLVAAGDVGQLAQRVRATQLVLDVEVAVVGHPGVVHGDAAEPVEHTSIVDSGFAAFGGGR